MDKFNSTILSAINLKTKRDIHQENEAIEKAPVIDGPFGKHLSPFGSPVVDPLPVPTSTDPQTEIASTFCVTSADSSDDIVIEEIPDLEDVDCDNLIGIPWGLDADPLDVSEIGENPTYQELYDYVMVKSEYFPGKPFKKRNRKTKIFNRVLNPNEVFVDPANAAVLKIVRPIPDPIFERPEITQDQEWDIPRIAREFTPPGWIDLFDECEVAFRELQKSINVLGAIDPVNGNTYFPLKCDLFKAFDICPLRKVKVVIVGQDPYHTTDIHGNPVAMGLSFSVRQGVSVPRSLANIYNEIKNSYPTFRIPNHGDLTGWATQGVLLLNTALTVKPHAAASHTKYWVEFTKKVIQEIVRTNPKCIFVLWGRKAENLVGPLLSQNNPKLVSSHPSPLSYKKGRNKFDGCGHFGSINEILKDLGKEPINWQV